MAKIFLISNDTKKNNKFETFFKKYKFDYKIETQENLIGQGVKDFSPDLVLTDFMFSNYENVLKVLKSANSNSNMQSVVLINATAFKDKEFPQFADGFIQIPLNDNILKSAVNSYLNIKNSLDKLSNNNKELSKSLYQINSLYNTSSQFAGALEKEKLCNIMLEGLEKILSFDMATVLLFANKEKANLHIKSLYELSPSLEDAIKIRLSLKYNNVFEDEPPQFKLNINDIKTIKNVKNSKQTFDLKILNYDTLFAQIKVGDNFFGVIEIIRHKPFLNEDVACFQTIVNQVAPPLRSATLYEEIKETNAKLEKLEHLKSDFVSIVSHELRTPLTPINNSLDIVLSGSAGEITEDTKNFVNMAKRNVLRLSGIIEDLLDLSRVQRAQMGKLDLKFKKTRILSSIDLVFKTFEQSAAEKNMDFKLDIKCDPTEIYADTRRIEQILSNLISNALKFTFEKGKIHVVVEKENPDKNVKFIDAVDKIPTDYLKITIEDDGIGIAEDDIPKIFDQFLQIESSLTRNNGGIGLGLAITKQLIDAHFGLISVESQKDKGSKFMVYLPLYSEKTAFEIDLNNLILKNDNIGIFLIEEDENCGFVKHLLDDKILKKTQGTKELLLNFKKYNYYWACLPNIEPSAFIFMENSIKNEIRSEKWKNCGIVLESANKKNTKKLHQITEKLDLVKEN